MHIIPVIDLLDGYVVHAKHGNRHTYQPIASKLTTSSRPLDIVKALMDVYPFKTLYIADLNAIQSLSMHQHLTTIHDISLHFPDISVWIDAGINNLKQANHYKQSNITPIIGSETLSTIEQYNTLTEQLNDFILSIDIHQDGYKGPDSLIQRPSQWPKNLIVMTLASVGSNHGVDISMLNKYKRLAPSINLYAAGGVRHLEDLRLLQKHNIAGALIASALHNKQLRTKDFNQLLA